MRAERHSSQGLGRGGTRRYADGNPRVHQRQRASRGRAFGFAARLFFRGRQRSNRPGGAATIKTASIEGDLLFDDNDGSVRATDNSIGGNLQAFQNTGGVAISNNVVDGNLQCKANVPAPTGGGNQASSKEDQCANL